MAGGFNNPIIGGGGSLVYPAIHSPGFQAGITGWTINKDGSAEFDNLTIRGTFNGNDFIINAQGFFIYSGPPANGNLLLAMANAPGIDDFGNAYKGPGIALSTPGSGTDNAIQLRPDKGAILVYTS